jgi:hypothetical protein
MKKDTTGAGTEGWGKEAPPRSKKSQLDADEIPVQLDLSTEEVEALQREKQALAEALKVDARIAQKTAARQVVAQDGLAQREGPARRPHLIIKPASPKEFAAARLASSRETGRLDAAVVQARLDEKTSALAAKEAELAEATERDRLAAEQRERERDALRLEMGAVQKEERAVREQQAGVALAERAAAYQESGAVNRQSESSDEADYRARWLAEAKPLAAKVSAFLDEVAPWAEETLPTLRKLAKMTWKDTPGTWDIRYRVQAADRAAGPARELIDSIVGAQQGGELILARVDAISAGTMKPTDALLARLVEVSKFRLKSLKSRLGVLNHELEAVEIRGRRSIRADQRIPTVEMKTRPLTPPEPGATVETGFDVHQ